MFVPYIIEEGNREDSHVLRIDSDVVLSGAGQLLMSCEESSNFSQSISETKERIRIKE